MLLNECTSRADLGTAAQQREYILDMIEPRESATPGDIRAVLDGSQHRDNAGHDFERMWVSGPMRDFFEALQDDYEASIDLMTMLSRHTDESPFIKRLFDKLVTELVQTL